MHAFARSNAFVFAVVIAASALLPLSLLIGSADAAQLTNRSVDLSANQTSEGSGRDGGDAFGDDVTYSVSFDLGSAHANLEGVVIDFCSDSPIVGDVCTAPTGFDTNFATLALANLVGGTTLSIDVANSDVNTVILTDATGDNLAGAATVSFDLGSTGAADGITNPTTAGTFYARILTYTDSTVAEVYDSVTPGAYTDDGGIAMAVANELTITARVQEVLQFCVGTTDAATNDDCTDISGTAINLGVVDSSSAQISALDEGLAMIRTNAFNGAVIYYKAEQNNASGALKVAGAACSPPSTTDQCFNSSGATQTAMVVGTEAFGMTATAVNTTNSSAPTANLTRNGEYDGDGTIGVGFAWLDTGAFATLASSSTVIDDEMLELAFAATASPTTPTGLYTVTANFVATATF
jgi:hypothetical protein